MRKFGIGSVWGEFTRTTTHAIGTVGALASATEAVAIQAERNAWLSVAQSALEICDELGIKNTDGSALTAPEAVKATDAIVVSLRGY